MITRSPAYNRAFRCLGGACPDTCCRDWEIVLDEDALADYRQAPSPLRERIAANLVTDPEGEVCFRLRPDGFCALLTPDGLCPIQRDWGEEHLCGHCGAYPRFTEEFGCLTETALAVSCPEAARLLMEAPRFALEEQDDSQPDPPFPGVDGGLLAGLEASRAAALALLDRREISLWERLSTLVSYANALQDLVDDWEYTAMASTSFPPPGEGETLDRRKTLGATLLGALRELEPLRPAWPELLARRQEELDSMPTADYRTLCTQYEQACPDWDDHLTNLACYLVFRHWHKTVNDDGLYPRAALVGAACLALYHLALLEWREEAALPPAREGALWSAFSREVEHMDENLTKLTEMLWDETCWPLLSAFCTTSSR